MSRESTRAASRISRLVNGAHGATSGGTRCRGRSSLHPPSPGACPPLTDPARSFSRRAFLAPAVVQTSWMDCGPAVLAALLSACRVHIASDDLRQACAADVDGTSLDTLETLVNTYGLDAEQVLVPPDHLLLPEARCLPAILVVRTVDDLPHFVLLWRRHGPLLQVMDPAVGRRWIPARRLLDRLYLHSAAVPETAWSTWARSRDGLDSFGARLARLGYASGAVQALLTPALADSGWYSLAAFDASLRLTRALRTAGALCAGRSTRAAFEAILHHCLTSPAAATAAVPPEFWSARAAGPARPGQVLVRGALLVRILGLAPPRDAATAAPAAAPCPPCSNSCPATSGSPCPPCSGSPCPPGSGPPCPPYSTSPCPLPSASHRPPNRFHPSAGALTEPPLGWLLRLWKVCGPLRLSDPALLLLAAAGAAGVVVVAPLVLTHLFLIWQAASHNGPGAASTSLLAATGAALALLAASLLLELALAHGARRLGRRLEFRFRLRLLRALPRLPDAFVRTRLAADLAERAHACHRLRLLPEQLLGFARAACELLLTCLGLVLLDRDALPLVLTALAAFLLAPLPLQSLFQALELRLRAAASAWSALFLDTLRGLSAIVSHTAQRTFELLHERRLRRTAQAQARLLGAQLWFEVALHTSALAAAAVVLRRHLLRHGFDGSELVLVYWILNLALLAPRWSAFWSAQLPAARHLVRRLLEPLAAAEGTEQEPSRLPACLPATAAPAPPPASSILAAVPVSFSRLLPSAGTSLAQGSLGAVATPSGLAVAFRDVAVRVAGQHLLYGIDLDLRAGEHVALVGPSGAGKSTLLGLLLGTHVPAEGCILIDGEPLADPAPLRAVTAWVAPEVRLWDRSLLANVRFGSPSDLSLAEDHALPRALRSSGLLSVLDRLPGGLGECLREGGSRLSGGEGQGVRLARASRRSAVRLALLDEPFRALDAPARRRLLARARRHWRASTLLYVTHRVSEALGFPRVLVLDRGTVVEDAPPAELAARPASRFHQLLAADRAARRLWTDPLWRHLRLGESNPAADHDLGAHRSHRSRATPSGPGVDRHRAATAAEPRQ